METKAFTLTQKSLDDEQGRATFLASVFNNVDHSKDRVLPGFFKESLESRLPKFVLDHDWRVEKRLGRVVSAQETGEGLEVEVEFNLDKQLAREVYSDFKRYPEDQEFSFGFTVEEFKPNQHGGRDLIKGDVLEVSPVLIGDNPMTRLVDVKLAEALKDAVQGYGKPKKPKKDDSKKDDEETLTDGEQRVASAAVQALRERIAAAEESILSSFTQV